jgi:hypothetical protein
LAAALTACSATGAQADQWCGSASHDNAVVECGYSTEAHCTSAVGKGGMCFVDPNIALNSRSFKHALPFTRTKLPTES